MKNKQYTKEEIEAIHERVREFNKNPFQDYTEQILEDINYFRQEEINRIGKMIRESDSMTTTEYLTKEQIIEKYGDRLTEEEKNKLTK